LPYGRHVETNVCLCRIYVRAPDMEIGRTTKEGLTADKLFDSNVSPQKNMDFSDYKLYSRNC